MTSSNTPNLSPIIYGCWRLQDDPNNASTQHTLTKIQTCLDNNINTFDHADIYGNFACETAFGQALKQSPTLKQKIKIITKTGIKITSEKFPDTTIPHYNSTKKYIIEQAEQSLTNLNIESIDILLIHRPDFLMDATETADALTTLIKQGKIKTRWRLKFHTLTVLPFAIKTTNTTRHKPNRILHSKQRTTHRRLTRPMPNNTISNPWHGHQQPPEKSSQALLNKQQEHEKYSTKSHQIHNTTIDQIAYAWILKHPANPIPIIGSNNPARIASAANAINIKLTHQQWYQILHATRGHHIA